MQITCPSCFSRFPLESALSDDAARELMVLLAQQPKELSVLMVQYLSLFRSKSRALAWHRALKLVHEVLALTDDEAKLAHSLNDTVHSLREKQLASINWKPMSNHNYLKRVLETVTGYTAIADRSVLSMPAKQSKTVTGIKKLQDKKR